MGTPWWYGAAAIHAMWLRLALAAILVTSLTAVVRVCAAPLDMSGTSAPPSVVASVKENDAVAYPAHVMLARALEAFRCSATATALQWLKAAAHARSAAEVAQAASGLTAARQRSSAVELLDRALCQYLRGGAANIIQAQAIAQTGLVCTERSDPAP